MADRDIGGVEMTRKQLDRRLDELESRVLGGDSDFARRWKALERLSTLHVVAVSSLLAVSALLLSAGLMMLLTAGPTMQSVLAWSAGIMAFALSFVADHGLRRTLLPLSVGGRARRHRVGRPA
jgi:hypothetical protein